MRSFTDDPVLDAQRYIEDQEEQFEMENRRKHCEICGRPCARIRHYEFDDVIICRRCLSIAFKTEIIPADVLEDMAFEYEVNR